ncbi:MAG: hypothetical protein WCD63_02275 [Terrimicrobiaceae bacterium]
MKRRTLKASVRETLEKAALLGVEFSVPVLLSAGASPDGLDSLFDDGWLAEAGPNRARAAEKACLQRRFRHALGFLRQALDIWSADLESDSRLRTLEEMARCAMNCREHSIARLAWEEICEMTPDTKRLVEAHR